MLRSYSDRDVINFQPQWLHSFTLVDDAVLAQCASREEVGRYTSLALVKLAPPLSLLQIHCAPFTCSKIYPVVYSFLSEPNWVPDEVPETESISLQEGVFHKMLMLPWFLGERMRTLHPTPDHSSYAKSSNNDPREGCM